MKCRWWLPLRKGHVSQRVHSDSCTVSCLGRDRRQRREERRRRRAAWKLEVSRHIEILDALRLRQQRQIEDQQETLLQMRQDLNRIRSLFVHLEVRLSNVVPQLEHFREGLQDYLEH